MRVFFKKMGIENLRFKPAYNPYTEVCRSHLLGCARDKASKNFPPFFFQIMIAIARDFRVSPDVKQVG